MRSILHFDTGVRWMTDQPDTEEKTVLRAESGSSGPKGLVREMTAKHVAFIGWVVAAGAYGYAAAEWGNAAVDTATAKPYPEYAWLFLLLGLSIGVAMSASLVASGDGDEKQER